MIPFPDFFYGRTASCTGRTYKRHRNFDEDGFSEMGEGALKACKRMEIFLWCADDIASRNSDAG